MKRLTIATIAVFCLGAEPVGDAASRLVDEFRKANKLQTLSRNELLAKAAQDHADNLARQDKLGDAGNPHVLDGKSLVDRVEAVGYVYAFVAENIQVNTFRDPAKTAFAGWLGSPPHKATMLSAVATEAGMGAARGKSGRWYFVHVFGKPQ
jgi:uncharacterized protein YkwD